MGHAAGPGHGSMHFTTAFGPSQAVLFALECDLRGFFSSGFVLKHPTFIQMRLLAGIRKRCHFETAIKVNAQVVCITKPSPVAAPFVCSGLPVSLFSSAVWRQTMKIFLVFSQSWATAFWEDKHNIHLIAGENPMAFFQWFKVMLSMSTLFALLPSKCYCNIWHVFC